MKLPNLELISYAHGSGSGASTPLLFVHGAWHGAWCWDVHFLPWFYEQGYNVYALSLRKHGNSNGNKPLWRTGIADYVNDVETVMAQLSAPPVVIGHSMGGFVVQKLLEKNKTPLAGAVLLAPMPNFSAWKIVLQLARLYPLRFIMANLNLSFYAFVNTPELVKQLFFSDNMPLNEVTVFAKQMQDESYRVMWEWLLQLPKPHHIQKLPPVLVAGAGNDFLIPPKETQRTARIYHTQAVILPHLAHDIMLDSNWQAAASLLKEWLAAHIA